MSVATLPDSVGQNGDWSIIAQQWNAAEYYVSNASDDMQFEETVDRKGKGRELPTNSYVRFPLRKYLRECGLPTYSYQGLDLLDEMKSERKYAWPKIAGLRIRDQPRRLGLVSRYADYAHIRNEIYSFFKSMSVDDEEMRQFPARSFEFDLPFRLPHPELVEFDDDDRRALNDIQNETEMIFTINKYLFHTVYSAISLMHGWNPREPNDLWKIKKFIFEISNSLFIEPHAKWDIFALPSRNGDAIPLVLVFIHPKYFDKQDFNILVRERLFADNIHKPREPADVIWAMLYDILKGKGRRFVVTNYSRWAFGQFQFDKHCRDSDGREFVQDVGYITEIYQAPLADSTEAGRSERIPPDQYCNPIELLIRWMADIPEQDQIFPNRYEDPRNVDAIFRAMHG